MLLVPCLPFLPLFFHLLDQRRQIQLILLQLCPLLLRQHVLLYGQLCCAQDPVVPLVDGLLGQPTECLLHVGIFVEKVVAPQTQAVEGRQVVSPLLKGAAHEAPLDERKSHALRFELLGNRKSESVKCRMSAILWLGCDW